MRKAPAREKASEVLPKAPDRAPSGGRPAATPAEAILPRLLEPLRRGEGQRVGWLGNTGMGKTYAASWWMDEARRRGFIDVALVLDDKNTESVYRGTVRVSPADLAARPPAEGEDPNAVIYRGVALDPATSVDVNDVATQAWELALAPGRPRVVVVIDELRRAVSPAGREWRAPAVARSLTEGRAVGLSVSWATQSPQRIPVDAFDNSDLCVFGLGHRGRAYLERSDLISAEVSRVIASLAPRQFVLIDPAGDWDSRVYEIPFRR